MKKYAWVASGTAMHVHIAEDSSHRTLCGMDRQYLTFSYVRMDKRFVCLRCEKSYRSEHLQPVPDEWP